METSSAPNSSPLLEHAAIGRRAFNTHGRDMIKDEMLPPVAVYPGFILSMNAEP